jgi:hypothetical protein
MQDGLSGNIPSRSDTLPMQQPRSTPHGIVRIFGQYGVLDCGPGNENLAGEEGPERKFSSFAAVRTRRLPRSMNLRSGQRDYHI